MVEDGKKYTVEGPKGTFSCDIGISVDEWQNILTNKELIENRTISFIEDVMKAFVTGGIK